MVDHPKEECRIKFCDGVRVPHIGRHLHGPGISRRWKGILEGVDLDTKETDRFVKGEYDVARCACPGSEEL